MFLLLSKDLNYLNSHSYIHFDPNIMLGLANTPKNQDLFAVSRFPIHNSTYFLFSSTFNPFLLPRRPLFLLFTQFSLNLMHLFLPSFSPLCFLSIVPQDFPIFAPFPSPRLLLRSHKITSSLLFTCLWKYFWTFTSLYSFCRPFVRPFTLFKLFLQFSPHFHRKAN